MARQTPNGPEGFLTIFADIGALINIYNTINDGGTNLESQLTVAVEEMDYDYGTIKWLPTFISNMVSARNNLTTGATNLVSSFNSYLTTVTAVDIGSTATTASGVLADLIQHMNGSTTGSPSGLKLVTDGVYHTFMQAATDVEWSTVTVGTTELTAAEAIDIKNSFTVASGITHLPGAQRAIPDTYPGDY